MEMTDGQKRAVEQLRDVEAAAGGLFIVESVDEPSKPGEWLSAVVNFSCADLKRAEGGLPLEDREQIVILVPSNFPFDPPHTFVRHDRFAGFPHVQWKHSLCMYQAPTTEWNPSDGMFGFLDRLYFWLQQGALGQLDPIGAPLHPPVAYLADGPVRTVIPRVDTPPIANVPWFGTAHLRVVSDTRVDLVGWSPFLDSATPQSVAAAILLPEPFPYEFPSTVGDLIKALANRGVSRERLFLTMQWAVIHNDENAPLYVVIGTPMRGTSGGELSQHLTSWYIEPVFAWGLKAAFDKHAEDEQTRASGEKIEKILLDWASVAKATWCATREDRPEIVTRRDRGSPLAWFSGRTVAVWGCGALGGHVAEHLTRAGAKKLILRDSGIVTPGILVRQPFDDADIGRAKAFALRDRLRRIRPDMEIDAHTGCILDEPLGGTGWVSGADVVIDATASTPVMHFLELCRSKVPVGSAAPMLSMAIAHNADRGMVTLVRPTHTGGTLDVCRRLKLEASERADLAGYFNEFWPSVPRPFFQPEPGCSDATFIGSSADVAGLAALMLNRVAADLSSASDRHTATGHFVVQPHAIPSGESPSASFAWNADHLSLDIHAGYQIRISPAAWACMRSWIVKSKEAVGPKAETGGLLFGERDDATGVIWVSEVSGPPADSTASAEEFVCGIEGTAELNHDKRNRTRGSVQYLGMWHTHPDTYPLPSSTDWQGMQRLVAEAGGASRSLMLIIGSPHGTPMLGTYVFRAQDFHASHGSTIIRPCVIHAAPWDE